MTGETHPEQLIMAALSKWSGLPPDAHKGDAKGIFLADMFQIRKPKTARDRAERIHKSCVEIERSLSSMTWQERVGFYRGLTTSRHTSTFRLTPRMWNVRSIGDDNPIFAFLRALNDGAKQAMSAAERTIDQHQLKSENADMRNQIVALQVAEICIRINKNFKPPKRGVDGPLQRLLHYVYEALGRPDVDLRGPLLAVHDFIKNRKS